MSDLAELDIPRFSEPALCAETDAEAFYPEKGSGVAAAKAICALCGAREECLAYALDRGLNHWWDGVWGGMSPTERRNLASTPTERREQRHAEILALHDQGATVATIARQLGVPPTTVQWVIRTKAPADADTAGPTTTAGPDQEINDRTDAVAAEVSDALPVAEALIPVIDVVPQPDPAPMAQARRWTSDELGAAVAELRRHGFRPADIARELGVTTRTVQRVAA